MMSSWFSRVRVATGAVDALAGVGDQVLDLRQHAGGDILEALARHAAAGRAEAGEVVLPGPHVAREREVVGLQQHLEEGIVPADAERLAVLLIERGDVAIARIELGVALGRDSASADRASRIAARAGLREMRISGSSGPRAGLAAALSRASKARPTAASPSAWPGQIRHAHHARNVPFRSAERWQAASRSAPTAAHSHRRLAWDQPSGQSSKALSRACDWLVNSPVILPSLA